MTINFKNVYIKDTSLVVGPFVKDGPLKNFDKVYKMKCCQQFLSSNLKENNEWCFFQIR